MDSKNCDPPPTTGAVATDSGEVEHVPMFAEHAQFPPIHTVSSTQHPVDALREAVDGDQWADHVGMARIRQMMDFNGFGVYEVHEGQQRDHFAHTVGLHRLGHPEFIVFGLPSWAAFILLCDLADRVALDGLFFHRTDSPIELNEGPWSGANQVLLQEMWETERHLVLPNALWRQAGIDEWPVPALRVLFDASPGGRRSATSQIRYVGGCGVHRRLGPPDASDEESCGLALERLLPPSAPRPIRLTRRGVRRSFSSESLDESTVVVPRTGGESHSSHQCRVLVDLVRGVPRGVDAGHLVMSTAVADDLVLPCAVCRPHAYARVSALKAPLGSTQAKREKLELVMADIDAHIPQRVDPVMAEDAEAHGRH